MYSMTSPLRHIRSATLFTFHRDLLPLHIFPQRNTHVAYHYVIIKFCATEFEWNVRDSPRLLLSMPDRPFLNDFSNFVWPKSSGFCDRNTFFVKKSKIISQFLFNNKISRTLTHSAEFLKRKTIDDLAVIIYI